MYEWLHPIVHRSFSATVTNTYAVRTPRAPRGTPLATDRGMRLTMLSFALLLGLTASACIVTDEPIYYEEEYYEPAFTWGTITVDNQSIYDIDELYIAPVGSSSWGGNQLDYILEPGTAIDVDVPAADLYDLLIVDEGGLDCQISDVDLRFDNSAEYVISSDFLDNCNG